MVWIVFLYQYLPDFGILAKSFSSFISKFTLFLHSQIKDMHRNAAEFERY